MLRRRHPVTSSVTDTPLLRTSNAVALLLLVSPAGTDCHLLVSSPLAAHLDDWREQQRGSWYAGVALSHLANWEGVDASDLKCELHIVCVQATVTLPVLLFPRSISLS